MANAFSVPPGVIGLGAKPTLPATTDKRAAPATPPAAAPNPFGIPSAALPFVQPQLNLIQSQQDQQKQALTEFTKAVLGQLAGQAPQIGADYNTAISQSQGLAQAGSDSLARANGNDSIQSILRAANAPANQQAQVADHLNSVFNGGSAALFGAQGVIPGQTLIDHKAAALAFANELPGINAQAGTNALKNLLANSGLEQQKVLATVPTILKDLADQKIRSDTLAATQQNNAFNQNAKTQQLTLATGKQAFDQWAKTQGVNQSWGRLSLDQKKLFVQQQNDAAKLAISQQNADTARMSAGKLQGKTVNGHAVTFDPATGQYLVPGTSTPYAPGALTKPPSAAESKQFAAARSYLQQARTGYRAALNDSASPLSTGQLQSLAKASGMKLGELLQITDPKQLATLGIGYVKVGSNEDAKIQNTYLTLVNKYGIPAQRAFNMVAKAYGEWGTHNRSAYFPKASAAQGAAYTGGPLNPTQQTDLAKRALQMVAPNLATPANVQALVGRINQESGGNPRSVNNWDSNAKAGTPSKGILQTIDSTFSQYAVPGHTDIWNPLDNTLAAIRYMLARYGHIVGPSNSGY